MSFPESENDQELEALLTETFGPPPRDDIAAWRKRYPAALAWLNPQRISVLSQRRKRMQRITILAATTAAAICVWLGLSHFGGNGTGASAFAQTVEQIQKAKDITWTTTIYVRITSKDGKRHWYRTNVRKLAYKAPGLYRETAIDEKGNVEWVEITDAVQKKVLTLCPSNKTAMIAEIRPPKDPEGPFLDAQRMLKNFDLQFVEKRKTTTGDVNVFRQVEGGSFFDCWIDQKSKRLIEYRINQGKHVTLADYENDPMRDAKPEKESSRGTIVGSITNDIVYNADLGDALFRFDVPKGYALTTQKRHLVTEQEMLDYFRVVVDADDNVFPADLSQPSSDQLNRYLKMPKAERSPQAQKLIDTVEYYERIQLGGLPLHKFLLENADWLSFRYFGKGVKLGDKTAIVCWYKLKDAKDRNTYRVVYGDLSVKDVAAKDLPLPVEP